MRALLNLLLNLPWWGSLAVIAGLAVAAYLLGWYFKYKYDFVRPITAIREQYQNQYINSWLGPNQGYGMVLGQNWIPYQAPNVVTPGFPSRRRRPRPHVRRLH